MNRTLRAGLMVAALCMAQAASAAILFQRSLMVDRSINIFTTSQFDVDFVFGDAFFTPSNPVKLFDGLMLTPGSIGQMFEANASSDAGFAQVASRLTDGRDDFVRLIMSEVASGRAEQRGWRESGFFVGAGSTEVPDLLGAKIAAIQLKVDGFRLGATGASTTALSLPPVELQLTFTVIGVPEPSSLALSAAGLAAAITGVYTVAGKRRRYGV
jgi:hypothetical protein